MRLVWANVGGAVPGEISMSTFAQPGRYTYCIGEREEDSPWEPLHVEHGFVATDSTVALLAAEAPQVVVDARSRTAPSCSPRSPAAARPSRARTVGGLGDTLLVIAPEHAATIAADGWSKADVRDVPVGAHARVDRRRTDPEAPHADNLQIVVAGGTAGRFSAWVPGWPFRDSPSSLVVKRISGP